MQTILKICRSAVPILFLGYAGFVNWSIFAKNGLDGEIGTDMLTGGATAAFSALYGKAQPHRDTAFGVIGAGRYALIREGRDGVVAGRDGWLFTQEEFDPASDFALDAMIALVADVKRDLAGLGVALIVVPVPAKIDIYRAHGNADAGLAMEMQYHAFRTRLDSAGIASVDTRPALAGAGDEPVFLSRDTHWTPEGARRVAEAVAVAGMIPQGQTAFRKVPARPEEFLGDLVSFVTSDALAPLVGLGPESVTPYVAEKVDAAAVGIFAAGGPSVETVLVGTSYSANKNWSFVPALQLATEQDILNLAKEGLGPVTPMQALLTDPSFAESPPARVIWEFPIRYLGKPQSTSELSTDDTDPPTEKETNRG